MSSVFNISIETCVYAEAMNYKTIKLLRLQNYKIIQVLRPQDDKTTTTIKLLKIRR